MDLGLAGKTIFVTGASGGIGGAIVRQVAAEGANVVVHYFRNHESAESIVHQIGEQALAVKANLTDESEVDTAFNSAIARFGKLDVLVANAGVWPSDHVPIGEMSLNQWQLTLETNLTSVFLCCRAFLRNVVESGINDPSIVMIGSTAGIFGEAGHADYAATKSGLTYGLMLSLKNEIAQIATRGRVNTVCPGWTVTPMAKKFTDDGESIKRALSTIAMRKVATADDVASAVLFLSSSKAAGHITGQFLTVSGGMEGRKLYDENELDLQSAMPDN